jgi:hypothetical protein
MAHLPNPIHLHGGNYEVSFGSASSIPKPRSTTNSSTVVSTNKFSTLEFYACQRGGDETEEVATNDENFGDVDEDEYDQFSAESDNIEPEVEKSNFTSEELFQQELERRALEDESEENAFREEFLSDVLKPVLDSSYKYPTVSVMVLFIII